MPKNSASRPASNIASRALFVTLTYAAYYERVLMVARGLGKMHVKPGTGLQFFRKTGPAGLSLTWEFSAAAR